MKTISNCVLCGSSDYKVLFEAGESQRHRIVKCSKCGLMSANPQQYVDSEAVSAEDVSEPFTMADALVQKNFNQMSDYRRIADELEVLLPDKGKLLEVGPQFGVLLNFLKEKGWDVQGIEPGKRAAAFAKSRFGFDFVQSTLDESDFADAEFNAVVMTHVIEHMSDPVACLAVLKRILKPGGVVVVETPRFDTLAFKLLGRRERSLRHKGHLFFFTFDTLAELLNRNGFSVVRQVAVGRTLSMERLLWNVGLISKSSRVQRLLSRISKRMRLSRFLVRLNFRDMQRVYCVRT